MTPPRIVPDAAAGRSAAIEVLRGGGIVALPTDTVYGITVALTTPAGIERLFHVKQRPPDKAIALLLADAAQARTFADLPEAAEALAAALWPGPLTLVLRARPDARVPEALTAGGLTVGLRVPDHDSPRALAAAVGPLPTTSANRSGRPDPLDAATVVAELPDGIDLVLDGGRTPGSRPSTVVDVTVDPPIVLRHGAVDETTVREILAAASGGAAAPAPAPDRAGRTRR